MESRLDIKSVSDMLKELSSLLIIEGVKEKDLKCILVGNTLSMALVSIELGPDAIMGMMKACNPHAGYIKEQIDAGKLTSLSSNTQKVSHFKLSDIDIEAILKGTGVRPSNEPLK